MSDDPFAAFSVKGSKKEVPNDDPFGGLRSASSGNADPFGSFGTPAGLTKSASPDPFGAFGIPQKPVSNDPFAAFKPAAGLDPFAEIVSSSDPFGGISTSLQSPPTSDPFSIPVIQSNSFPESESSAETKTQSFPPKALLPANLVSGTSAGFDSDPFSQIMSTPDPSVELISPNPFSTSGNISAARSADSSLDGATEMSIRSSPVVRQRASIGAPSDVSSAGDRIIPPRPPIGSPGRSTASSKSPAPSRMPKPPPPPKAEKPGKILASNFSSKTTPAPTGDTRSLPSSSSPDFSTERSSPQLPSKNVRQGMRHTLYSGPKTFDSGKSQGPFWKQHSFFDVFIDLPRSQFLPDDDNALHPVQRIRSSCHMMHEAIVNQMSCFSSNSFPSIASVTESILTALYEATILFDLFPFPLDSASIYAFLNHFIMRLRRMKPFEFLLFPCAWTSEKVPCASIIVIYKVNDDTDSGFTVAVVNCDKFSGGLDYHASKADPRNGSVLMNLALEIVDIENEKIYTPAFW